ncbi:MAG: methyltransferase domain-containing protein [Proteobacteria bacterium]|nr:methyltransferase domain-containing protein [Pseudomonadota bacterium]
MRVHFHLRRSGRLIDGPCQDLIVLLLRCPVCHAHLRSDGNAAACARGHTFDRAREGYLNLLPVQQKNSLNPGDNAAMVGARSEFLDAGYYEPLRVALVRVLADVRPTDLLDSGCGEGWYSTALSRTAAATTALDISKDAIKRAARRDRAITWLVASMDSLAPTFTLLRDSRVQFPIDLPDHAAVNALLKMTPYYWRAERQRRAQVEALTGLSTQADFRILHFVREA